MKKGIVSWIFLITTSVSAQDAIRLNGRIVDRKSGQPLHYATISIQGASKGSVSNQSGDFDFYVAQHFEDDTLMISYIGYKTLMARVADIRRDTILYLDESPLILNEVVVTSDGAKILIEKAREAIPVVYATTSYIMEGFHRSWEKVDFTDSISYPGTLIEAAVTIFDPGYGMAKSQNKREEEVYINEVRRSSINKGWNYDNSALHHLLKRNLVKYNDEAGWNFIKSFFTLSHNLIYEWEGDTFIDDEAVSIIRIEIPNERMFPASFKVYISHDDYAILRFDLTGEKKEIDYSLGPWHTETFIFKRYKDIPYLRYATLHYIIKNLDTVRKKVLRTEEYHREIMINNVITSDVDEMRKMLVKKKSKNISLALQSGTYNEAFWKTYNVIRENPIDLEIIEYFNSNTYSK